MKARIPLSGNIRQRVKEEARKEIDSIVRRTLKIALNTLIDEFGFGEKRLKQYNKKFMELIEEQHKDDDVFWFHIDEELHKRGIHFEDETIDF